MTFTDAQIQHFKQYEKVRASGEFNMWDPRAQRAARLNEEDFLFVLANYTALQQQAEETKDIAI